MSERTNKGGATSGQKVPKSPKSKFRAKSQQEQTAESKLRMEKRGEQLDKAKKKLAKQKPPKKSGPVKRRAGRRVQPFMGMCMASSMRWSMRMSAPKAPTDPSWSVKPPCTPHPGM